MGNTPLTIGLKVDNANSRGIVAGSIVRGRIYLSNKQSENAHSIRLKLIGIEEAVVHHTSTESVSSSRHNHGHGNHNRNHNHNHHSETETRDYYEQHSDTFYQIDGTIKEFPGGVIPKGQFEYPFALELPKSLPSSMKARTGQSHCEVRYEIIAEVFQKPNTLFHHNPHHKETLTVVAMPSMVAPDHDTSLHLPAEIVPISSCNCCCFASCTKIGTMALESKFDKTTLFLDAPSAPEFSHRNSRNRQPHAFQSQEGHHLQSFGIQFRCENKSTEKVKAVKTDLVETIEWSVNGHTASVKSTLATQTRDAFLYSELKPMWHKPFQWQLHRHESNVPLLGVNPWRSIGPLNVDGSLATDTYRGTAVKVRHVLGVHILTQGCCATNPDASALVEIYRNPLAFGGSEVPQAPFVGAATKTPSAPFEDELAPSDEFSKPTTASAHATAPSSVYDDSSPGYNTTNAVSQVPLAQAQLVLPEDWNAHTAECVTIPIVEAKVVGN